MGKTTTIVTFTALMLVVTDKATAPCSCICLKPTPPLVNAFPGFFRTTTEQAHFLEQMTKLESCPRPVSVSEYPHRHRRSIPTKNHGCCTSTARTRPFSQLYDLNNQVVNILQLSQYKQYFLHETCNVNTVHCAVAGCNCQQFWTLSYAIVVKPSNFYEMILVKVPGACKCINNIACQQRNKRQTKSYTTAHPILPTQHTSVQLLEISSVVDEFPGFFRNTTEQAYFLEEMTKLESCPRPVPEYPHRHRRSISTKRHGCCTSTARTRSFSRLYDTNNQVVNILQFSQHKQYFLHETCSSDIGLCAVSGCNCQQFWALSYAIVVRPSGNPEMSLVKVPGSCKCINNFGSQYPSQIQKPKPKTEQQLYHGRKKF